MTKVSIQEYYRRAEELTRLCGFALMDRQLIKQFGVDSGGFDRQQQLDDTLEDIRSDHAEFQDLDYPSVARWSQPTSFTDMRKGIRGIVEHTLAG